MNYFAMLPVAQLLVLVLLAMFLGYACLTLATLMRYLDELIIARRVERKMSQRRPEQHEQVWMQESSLFR